MAQLQALDGTAVSNEFAADDIRMVDAFFEQAGLTGHSSYAIYRAKCTDRNQAVTVRAAILKRLHESKQTSVPPDKGPAILVSAEPVPEAQDAGPALPRKKAIKRRDRQLRLCIEHLKRVLLKTNMAVQVHKQNLQSTETITNVVLGGDRSSAMEQIANSVNKATGDAATAGSTDAHTTVAAGNLYVSPEGAKTAEYRLLESTARELADIRATGTIGGYQSARHFAGQHVFTILYFPALLSPKIKGKLKAIGGLLVFDKYNAGVFLTVFATPLAQRKFTGTIIRLCTSENHHVDVIFAGNRYLYGSACAKSCSFQAVREGELEESIVCQALELDASAPSLHSTTNSIIAAVRCAFSISH